MARRLLTIAALLTPFALAPHVGARPGEGGGWLQAVPIAPGLWRGRAPYLPRHYEELRRLGVRTVLDIRGNQPLASAYERRRAEAHGLVYRHVPMGFRPLRDGSGERVLAALQNQADYPLYVHCNVDRDRTSAVVGVCRVCVDGWSLEAAEAEARWFGIRRRFVGLNRYLWIRGAECERGRMAAAGMR